MESLGRVSSVGGQKLSPSDSPLKKDVSPAHKAMNILEDELNCLFNQIDSLEQRIAPALTGSTPPSNTVEASDPSFGGSAIVEKIQAFTSVIRRARIRLLAIADRVEL